MKLSLEANGRIIEFKIDSGFNGECILSHDVFRTLSGEEFEGPLVRLPDGRVYSTKMKIVIVKFLNREIYTTCISNIYIDKNLIGEKLLERLQIILDYKNLQVKDP